MKIKDAKPYKLFGVEEEDAEPTYSENYNRYLDYKNQYNDDMKTYVDGKQEWTDMQNKANEYYGLSEKYMKDYINRDKFSYDINTDQMYAMYRDQYLKNAQQAQQDAAAQAAGLTGGYGSTYASAMGQQAYSTEMDKLDAKASELYENAYNRYQEEGQNLLNAASLYSSQAENLNSRLANDKAQFLSDAQLKSAYANQLYQDSDEYKTATAAEEEKEDKLSASKSLKEAFASDAKIASSKYGMQKDGSQSGYKGIANAIDLERDVMKNIETKYKSADAFIEDLYTRLSTVTIGGSPMTDEEKAIYVDWVLSAYADEIPFDV